MGEVCARPGCEERETRIHGYCSVYCEDVHAYQQDAEEARAALVKLADVIRRMLEGIKDGRVKVDGGLVLAEGLAYPWSKEWCTRAEQALEAAEEVLR